MDIIIISSTRSETIILMFVAEATVFLELFPINYLIKKSELFQNEGIEIQPNWLEILNKINENGEWSEFVRKEKNSSRKVSSERHG